MTSLLVFIVSACTPDWNHKDAKPIGAIRVVDGEGKRIILNAPAKRVIALSPHAVELIFAIGAGDQVIATASYTDYPPAATKLPTVGDTYQLDIEKIISLKPDLIVLWPNGSALRQIELLERTGIPIYRSNPRKLVDIPIDMVNLARLTGHQAEGEQLASDWRDHIAMFRGQYTSQQKIQVFYQIYDQPLYTIGKKQIINDAISLCGGKNVLDDVNVSALAVDDEVVLGRDPDAIISTVDANDHHGLRHWHHFPMLKAVRTQSLYFLNPDLISRPGPRMLKGIQLLCEQIDDARKRQITMKDQKGI